MSSKKGDSSSEVIKVPVRTISMASGTFNLCKAAIGIGILALPRAMAQSGLALGLGLLAFGSITTSSTLHFLARIAANTDMGDYFEVGKMAYNSIGEITAVSATLLYLIGALIGYMSYTTKYISAGVEYFVGAKDLWYTSKYFVIPICACLIFPLASLKDLSKLAKASIVGMCCMGFVCGLTVVDYFVDSSASVNPVYTPVVLGSTALQAFSTILFAFCNHFTMLSIVPAFINPTPRRRTTLLLTSSSVIFIFYLLVALFGYLHFGDAVGGNILMTRSNGLYAFAQLLIATVILVSYPLLCDPTKACCDFLVTKAIGSPINSATAHARNLSITAVLVALSAVTAMVAGDQVNIILGLFSSLCGSLLMFIFPALYFLRLSDKFPVSKTEKGFAYVDIVVGVIVLIFGTFFNAKELIAAFF